MLTLIKSMRYRTLDGVIFEADSSTELIRQLRDDSRTPSTDFQDFMEQMSRRCKIYSGAEISTDSFDAFVADLVAGGHLTEVE